jgi:hypothetical protein
MRQKSGTGKRQRSRSSRTSAVRPASSIRPKRRSASYWNAYAVDVEVRPSSDLGINVKVEPSSYFTTLVVKMENGIKLVSSITGGSGPGSAGRSSPDADAAGTMRCLVVFGRSRDTRGDYFLGNRR